MKQYVHALVLAVVSGCAGSGDVSPLPSRSLLFGAGFGTPITQSNKEVQMSHYSVVVPPDKGWHLSKPDNNKLEVAVLTKDIVPFRFLIQTMWVAIYDEKMKTVPTQTVADDYRNLEHQTMLKEGVAKGQYQLHNVVKEEENYGDKKFYTMRYSTTSGRGSQIAKLLLYFPKQEKNEYFILVHYSENGPSNAWTDEKPQRSELEEILKSLRVNQ